MTRPAESTRRVYHLGPRRRAVLLATWVLTVLPLLLLGLWTGDAAALATGLLVGVLMAAIFVSTGLYYPRLQLDADGIVRHNMGYRLATPWSNVLVLRREPGCEGLELMRPMEDRGARLAARFSQWAMPAVISLYPPDVRQLVAKRRFIPIEAFADWLREGDLEQELARHAPWLAAHAALARESAA